MRQDDGGIGGVRTCQWVTVMSVVLGNMFLNNTIRPDVAVRYAKPGKGPINMTDTATVVTVIDACARAGVPSLLVSAPGFGKTSLVRSLAKAQGIACETVLGSLREPSDFAGLPIVGEDGVRMEPRFGPNDSTPPGSASCFG